MPNKGTAKHNWVTIKQKYFDSDFIEVKAFLRDYLGIASNEPVHSDKMARVRGWTVEKRDYLTRASIIVQEKTIASPDVQKQASQLVLAMSNIEKKVANLLGGKTEFGIDDLPKVKVGYEMLRLATGQSTQNQGGDKNNPIQTETTHNLGNLGINDLKTLQDIITKTLE